MDLSIINTDRCNPRNILERKLKLGKRERCIPQPQYYVIICWRGSLVLIISLKWFLTQNYMPEQIHHAKNNCYIVCLPHDIIFLVLQNMHSLLTFYIYITRFYIVENTIICSKQYKLLCANKQVCTFVPQVMVCIFDLLFFFIVGSCFSSVW